MEVMRQELACVWHEDEILYNLTSLFLFNKPATKHVVVVTAVISTGSTHSNLRMRNRPARLSFLVFVLRTCRMDASIKTLPFPHHFQVTAYPRFDGMVSEALERRKIKE
jgi:hypothetical protein